jgi:hypothetical protein
VTVRFEHDCSTCQFLGQAGEFDMYWCPKCDEGSLIARYGSAGPEYASTPLFCLMPETVGRFSTKEYENYAPGHAFVWALKQEPVKTAYDKMVKERTR